MKKKLFALLAAASVAALCVPVLSACNTSAGYTLKTDGEGNKYYVASCTGAAASLGGELVIEDYYGEGENRYPVTEIAETGFSGTNITKVTIPATVKKIGAAAFAYNKLLRDVVFEDGIALEEISRGAFGYCELLNSVCIPASVSKVGDMSFIGCNLLREAEMTAVEVIGDRAFENCVSLQNVELPETLVTIGERAFCYSALSEIVIPDSVTQVGYAAFHSCTSLLSAVVGSGITEIKSGVFGYCTSLKDLWLPDTVVSIEGAHYNENVFYCGHPFHNDGALENIYYAGTEQLWDTLKGNINNEKVSEGGATFDNSPLLNAEIHFEVSFDK